MTDRKGSPGEEEVLGSGRTQERPSRALSHDSLTNWRPIETAPKDASDVLLLVPNKNGYPRTYLAVGHWAQGGGEEQPPFGPAWFYWDGYGFREFVQQPTHWMPLPSISAREAQAEPEGWRLVPREPTWAMFTAGADENDRQHRADNDRDSAGLWRAMWDAAPSYPTQGGGES